MIKNLSAIAGNIRDSGSIPEDPLEDGESHGQRSLADYNPWGRKELDWT